MSVMTQGIELVGPEDIKVADRPPFRHPSQIRGNWERIPIVDSCINRNREVLDERMRAGGGLLTAQEVVVLPEFQDLVASFEIGINQELDNFMNMDQANKDFELIDCVSDLLDLKDKEKLMENYARHQAMLNFLKSLRLLGRYFSGEVLPAIRTKRRLEKGKSIDEEDDLSWAVSIGYLPESRTIGDNPIYLTGEFLYGDKMQGYRQTIVASSLPKRLTQAELVSAGWALP